MSEFKTPLKKMEHIINGTVLNTEKDDSGTVFVSRERAKKLEEAYMKAYDNAWKSSDPDYLSIEKFIEMAKELR